MAILIFIFACVLILANPSIVDAQVVINEVLNNPEGDEKGAEWVELYNTKDTPQSLGSCKLYLDDSASTQVVSFSNEDFVEKYKIISWDKSWLNNSGDTIKLDCGSFSDSASYGNAPGSVVEAPKEGMTFGRSPDGVGEFYILSSVTQGTVNSFPPTSTPAPTNTYTPTPKPTQTSTPTPTHANTPTPMTTVTPTNKPTYTLTPKVLAEASNEDSSSEEDNLAEEDSSMNKEITNTNEVSSSKISEKRKLPLIAICFIVLGIGLIGAALFPFLKPYLKRYNFKKRKKI